MEETSADMDPELLAKADGDEAYLGRLAAAEIARRRFEAEPGDPVLRRLKYQMAQELVDFEISTKRRQIPPDETS